MSIKVETGSIAETMEGFAFAYLLTLGTSPRPHVVAVGVTAVDGALRVSEVGRSSRRNIEGDDAVTLLWPPRDAGGYSLIVDGNASVRGDEVVVVPERAVLHRPAPEAPAPADGSCAADCVELPVREGS
ncbi:hypothetical protein EV383_5694 [Pseudonocardia sediminis]|uniref:Pyridoxamine 5'-phosphate oxidase n=1 Tax=Pseudonocardia sediminis TaxID=1397368 RepID=A0A4Q7V7L5_PSEST|nr:pyridoxamine 5'-phosphate oxidase family protein [Pseudonocardia sediminis]RZT88749.1 hypothetical protein EV383_5694 [Pseudonocardia sediminis]